MWITNKLEKQQFVMCLFANKQNVCKQKQICDVFIISLLFFWLTKNSKSPNWSPGSRPGSNRGSSPGSSPSSKSWLESWL